MNSHHKVSTYLRVRNFGVRPVAKTNAAQPEKANGASVKKYNFIKGNIQEIYREHKGNI